MHVWVCCYFLTTRVWLVFFEWRQIFFPHSPLTFVVRLLWLESDDASFGVNFPKKTADSMSPATMTQRPNLTAIFAGFLGTQWAAAENFGQEKNVKRIDRVLRCHQLRDATFFVRKRVIYLACQIWEHEIWSDNFDQRAVVSTDQGLILLMNFAHKPLFIIHDRCITVWIQLHTIYAKLAEIVFQFQEWKANLEKISLPYHSL